LFLDGTEFVQVKTRRVIRGGSLGGAPVNLWVEYRDSILQMEDSSSWASLGEVTAAEETIRIVDEIGHETTTGSVSVIDSITMPAPRPE
jgi:hypothetical protein